MILKKITFIEFWLIQKQVTPHFWNIQPNIDVSDSSHENPGISTDNKDARRCYPHPHPRKGEKGKKSSSKRDEEMKSLNVNDTIVQLHSSFKNTIECNFIGNLIGSRVGLPWFHVLLKHVCFCCIIHCILIITHTNSNRIRRNQTRCPRQFSLFRKERRSPVVNCHNAMLRMI